MKISGKYVFAVLMGILLMLGSGDAFARTREASKKDKEQNELLRKVQTPPYDLQRNGVSALEFYNTNYGIFSYNVAAGDGGGTWPRGSNNQYIFAGGIWFAATKPQPKAVPTEPDTPRKFVVISYNPNNGRSWMVPGRIEDGDLVRTDKPTKYRTYFSTDYRPDGTPINKADGQENWPVWDTDANDTLKRNRYFGRYVQDDAKRNKETYPKGPAYISGEDIFSVFKDTDLSRYDGGAGPKRTYGYPLRLQFEQNIYSWGFGDYKDFVFLKYEIINMSNEILRDCWMSPVMDVDIALNNNRQEGAANDRARFYKEDTTLNLAYQWTEGNRGEAGRGFGYLGFDFLESPAVYPALVPVDTIPGSTGQDSVVFRMVGTSLDSVTFIRKDRKVYENREQLGLKTFYNWPISDDPHTENARYAMMSDGRKDDDNGAGDKRFMMATGPFTMKPGDTTRVVVGIIMALGVNGRDTDGSPKDVTELIRKDKFAQTVYDNNFEAPRPPDLGVMLVDHVETDRNNENPRFIKGWEGINNGVIVRWDSTSELSFDPREGGLDFMGYRLYRAQREDLDSFDVDNRPSARRGPLGWKQVAEWRLPAMFIKSILRPDAINAQDTLKPAMDSLVVLKQIDDYNYKVIRIPFGTRLGVVRGTALTGIRYNSGRTEKFIDSIQFLGGAPWSKYFEQLSNEKGMKWVIDNILTGTVTVDAAKVGGAKQDTVVKLRTFAGDGRDSIVQEYQFGAVLEYLKDRKGRVSFVDIEQDSVVRNHVITGYIDSVTNHRTFVDIGDDNRDGVVTLTSELTTTERLVNNIDYYYRILAYDEGDYRLPTPIKQNQGAKNVNQVRTTPLAAAAGKKAEITIVSTPGDSLGGIYNFRFLVQDGDRLKQLYAGQEIEVEFLPLTTAIRVPSVPVNVGEFKGIYGNLLLLKTRKKVGDVVITDTIAGYPTFYERTQCNTLFGSFSESASIFAAKDFNDTLYEDRGVGKADTVLAQALTRSGSFTTDVTCAPNGQRFINGAFGFAFDYTMLQEGGEFRNFSAEIESKDASNPANSLVRAVRGAELVEVTATGITRYNNGGKTYRVIFRPGGTEEMTVTLDGGGTNKPDIIKTFSVPYLEMDVLDVTSYTRSSNAGEVEVKYPGPVQHVTINYDTTDNAFSPTKHVPLDHYNFSAFGWVNSDFDPSNPTGGKNTAANRRLQATCRNNGCPVGTQGRYYLTAVNGADSIKFTHVFAANGVQYILDYANKEGRRSTRLPLIAKPADTLHAPMPTRDFVPGDAVVLRSYGGGIGLPMIGAKIVAKVSDTTGLEEYTDEMLNQVQVVPNPYYVSHIGQRSQYDSKIYFTKLPPRCSISIYTVNGDLIRKVEHDETTSIQPDREALDIWDLQSSNRQQSVSQVLIAKIETPNGANSIVKFSIVTSAFRQVPE